MAQLSKNGLLVQNNQSFPNNSTGYITPEKLRDYNVDVIDSTVNQTIYTSASAAWDNSISALNTFTASQQPSFTALNQFTASQLTINTGVNGFTQSANASINSLTAEVDQLQIFSASINEIRDDGVLQGYSTRFYFNGLVSASIVPNVGGAIANVTIEQDGTKLNTSSFDAYKTTINSYTASTNIRLNNLETFSSSAKISITSLNAFTASVGPIATGSLVTTSSFSGTTITFTKGNGTTYTNVGIQDTASFNSYTASVNTTTASLNTSITNLNTFSSSQLTKDSTLATYTASVNQRLTAIETVSGSWVTESETGSFARVNVSNSFTGSQTFSGSVITTGSVSGNVVSMSISSNTASMDLSKGNFFLLTLATGSVTRLEATNISKGQTANLLVSQQSLGTGSLLLSSTFKQPVGNAYTASLITGSQDIISFVSFDSTSTLYATSIKNLR